MAKTSKAKTAKKKTVKSLAPKAAKTRLVVGGRRRGPTYLTST
jgi:hypothetical protein